MESLICRFKTSTDPCSNVTFKYYHWSSISTGIFLFLSLNVSRDCKDWSNSNVWRETLMSFSEQKGAKGGRRKQARIKLQYEPATKWKFSLNFHQSKWELQINSTSQNNPIATAATTLLSEQQMSFLIAYPLFVVGNVGAVWRRRISVYVMTLLRVTRIRRSMKKFDILTPPSQLQCRWYFENPRVSVE